MRRQRKNRNQNNNNSNSGRRYRVTNTTSDMAVGTVAPLLRCTIPKSAQLFADSYECWGVTSTATANSSTSGYSDTFKANGSFNLFGPQTNWTGAFATNVPAGSYYLISTGSTNSVAPYGKCVTLGVEMEVKATNISITTPWELILVPTRTASLNAVGQTTIKEQRGAICVCFQPSNGAPALGKLAARTSAIYGVSEYEVRNNPDFAQAAGADPANLWYFHAYVRAMDGSTTGSVQLEYRFKFHFLFKELNIFTSTAPS